MNQRRAQLSVIAALLVAVVLVATVIVTYSIIRSSPIEEQPPIQSAIDEINFAIKQILGFTVGYYGSVLKVTGNSSYARMLASNYIDSGLVNIASMHPEWATSLDLVSSELYTYWFTNSSYSRGNLAVKYNLTGLGISGISYTTSCKLSVCITNTTDNQACLQVTKDEDEPVINLGRQNFKFFRYENLNSTWELISPTTEPIAYANGTYQIGTPAGVDLNCYLIQVEDPRGIITVASSFSRYTFTFDWSTPANSSLQDTTLVAELLQNGTLRWSGQNLQNQTQTKPVPPIPVKLIHVNQTTNNVSSEVPFQIEDWASDYQVPLGLSNNQSVFNSRSMLVFLVNPRVSNVTTIWWDGSDQASQTPLAYTSQYFTQDDVANGILKNGNDSLSHKLILSQTYLYVDGFNSTSTSWTEFGTTPYLNDDTSNYIRHNVNNQKEAWFTFQNLSTTYSQIFASPDQLIGAKVRIDFECKRDGSDDYFDFRINDGTTTYGSYSITPGSSYDWRSYDISDIINTTRKINNAKIEITYRQSGSGASNVYVRRCRLFLDFWLTSVTGNSTAKADFLRINTEYPVYGAAAAYVIHHGIVRDIVQQEAEWGTDLGDGGGPKDCPNVYSHIVLTLPANATFYTYQLRLTFVDSQQNRTLTDLCPIRLVSLSGVPQTENGTSTGYPIVVNGTGIFYNHSASAWQHHWSQFISGTKGAGIMFTDNANRKLYVFDSIAEDKTGGLKANSTAGTIELLPVTMVPADFTYALDVTWYGAVATFDGTAPIYNSNDQTGLWTIVEYLPMITITVQE